VLRHTDAFDLPTGPAQAVTSDADEWRNRLVWGDNRLVLEALLPELRGQVDLIYLDPPFDADQEFRMRAPLGENPGMGSSREEAVEAVAYRDIWGEGRESYAQMLYERLPLLRELLSETGSLIVHVNWRVGHVVQLLLDEVFGPGERSRPGAAGFRCEIIWGYGGGTAVKNVYRRKHDNLFWYTRSNRWTFNPQYRPYSAGTRERGLTAVKGDRYELRDEGAALETWWTGPEVQKILSPTAYENLKFPTQKPEALLERIVRGHSHEEDLVADFFCGSGTTAAVAERLGRRWIMADQGRHALLTTRKRLAALQQTQYAAGQPCRAFDVYEVLAE
jgi:DNA modification methylase